MSEAGRSACISWLIKSRARTEDGHSAYNLWVVKSRLRTTYLFNRYAVISRRGCDEKAKGDQTLLAFALAHLRTLKPLLLPPLCPQLRREGQK
jgi:hypothetical protein